MIRLRVATPADQKELEQFYEGFACAMQEYDEEDDDTKDEIQQWISYSLTNANGILLVTEIGNEIAGFARLTKKTRSDERGTVIPYVKLNDLYVKPSARRQGIARQLMEAAIQWANSQECKEIILHVYMQNMAARQLYTKMKFHEDKELSNHRIRMNYIL